MGTFLRLKKVSHKAGNTVLARYLFPIPIVTSIFRDFPQSHQVDARLLSRPTPTLHFVRRKSTISFFTSVRVEQLGTPLDVFS